ncbi:LysE family translocator [Castellaniella sp.]|uniref:LysE family translocator n=1 Tax=Castellaniella sp. TaxID=1955812 RepID=UPI00355EE9B2
MPGADTLTGFMGVALLLALSPGPDNLFVLVVSAQKGWQAGLAVVIGLCLGLVIQTTAVALGLAALFLASATAFMGLKIAGAAYLGYLAWGAFRAASQVGNMAAPGQSGGAVPTNGFHPLRMVGRGIIMNITNPKVLVFFLAFLPQFVDPSRGPIAIQIVVLGALFIVATLLVFGGIACFSGKAGDVLRRSAGVQRWLNRIAGGVFLGLALNLLVMRR